MRRLCTRFNLDTERAIRGMRDYVDDPTHEPQELRPLLDSIRSIPCSSSECERGFSVMNCIETDVRNSLLISNVSSLMFININGPPIELFNSTIHLSLSHGSFHTVLLPIHSLANVKRLFMTKLVIFYGKF